MFQGLGIIPLNRIEVTKNKADIFSDRKKSLNSHATL